MPVAVIGMIGVSPEGSGARVHVIEGGVSSSFLAEFAQAHEEAGFDRALVGYMAHAAEGFAVAQYAAAHTEKLGFLIAHRPGFVAPTLAARKAATFDVLTEGRLAMHIIVGVSDQEQHSDGDYLEKPQRYRRAGEYLEIMRRVWTEEQPFDFDGAFYRVDGAYSAVRPHQQPHPPLFFGGSSPEALETGAEHANYYALFGEPLADTAARIEQIRGLAAEHDRTINFNMSFRPIIAESEGAAWDKARGLLDAIEGSAERKATRPIDESSHRLVGIAQQGDVHDERLWFGIAAATGGVGNTSCLVGTSEQVAEALLKYYDLGVRSFLIRGFDPVNDAREYGRELIPRLKAGALNRDRA
jgi:alkanesulfonate monooxygenase